ncbi:MAG: T9SS type A sorting domain-containing protein [Bacteroidetes bacterium]|nr:T9SS type A sorting domain-containing protein [Bacteroidota bacterium]
MKSFKTPFFFVVLFAIALFAKAQSAEQVTKAYEIFENKPEVYLSFDASEMKEILNFYLSYDYQKEDRIFVYANKSAFELLLNMQIDFKVERSPGDIDFDPNMKTWEEILAKGNEKSWDFYPTYSGYVNMMYQFQTDYTNLVKIYNIGETVLGRDLLYAKITSNVNQQKAVPKFMYSSTMHGDEATGFVLMLRLIDYLASNYGTNPDITFLLDNLEIYICPNENPDGTYTNNDNTVSGATRSNANGVDLNRNYPNPVSQHSVRQPETIAMMSFTDTISFIMSANIHGGIELINYPWDSWTSGVKKHADHNWFILVSREYADTAQYYSPSGYMTAYGGVTHGGDWYVVYGSRQDYFTYYKYDREVTIEISDTKMVPGAQLPAYWDYNYRSFLNYMRQSLYGVKGLVKNAITLDPVVAKVEVLSHDAFNSEVYTGEMFGDYYRPLLAGTYSFKFSAPGYYDQTISNVSVTNYNTTQLDVMLVPEGTEFEVTIIVDPVASGTVTGAGVYDLGSPVTITASPNGDFVFQGWFLDGSLVNSQSEYTFNMPMENLEFTAKFSEEIAPETYNLTLLVNPAGTGTANGGGTYEEGEEVFVSATPIAGYVFVNWTIGSNIESTLREFQFTMPGSDVTMTANFELINNAAILLSEKLEIYPNPSNGEYFVSADNEIIEVIIYNIIGKVVYSQIINDVESRINLTGVDAGVYFMKIVLDSNVIVKKIQKL